MKRLQTKNSTHKVAMLVFPNAQILDVTGPLEVFARTSRWLKDNRVTDRPAYEVSLVAKQAGNVVCSNGLEMSVKHSIANVGQIDTLLVAGGIGYRDAANDHVVLDWVRRQAQTVERVGSICTGAFILAAAGLLHGKTATTHWAYCEQLRRQAPSTVVQPDAIFVRQDNVYTSAGVTSGMDMALAMIEDDWGQHVALAVAQELVLYLKRPGGQAQFSRQLAIQKLESSKLQELVLWISENPDADLSVETLATRMAMSVRNFSRRFHSEVGLTPAKFVEQMRIDAARSKLEQTALPVDKVAHNCGFESADNFRRAFSRVLGITPTEYRERFSLQANSSRAQD